MILTGIFVKLLELKFCADFMNFVFFVVLNTKHFLLGININKRKILIKRAFMKLEYYGVSKENLKSGLNMSITDSTRARYIKNIETKKVSDMLDWLDLPDMSEEEITRIESVASLSKKMTDFVVLGIGWNIFVNTIYKSIF